MAWNIQTLADAYRNQRHDSDEEEFRRGYRHGWIEATNAIFNIWFLGKDRAQAVLYEHWKGQLRDWQNTAVNNHMYPPPTEMRGAVCVYCGDPAEHLDHVHPKSRGGGSGDNLVPACATCNMFKGSRTPAEADMDFGVWHAELPY